MGKFAPLNAEGRRRHARNEAMAEHDHAPLREAILAILRETDFKVLVCPEDKSQMALGKRWILDRWPSWETKSIRQRRLLNLLSPLLRN